MSSEEILAAEGAPQNLIDQLCRDEGYRQFPYRDGVNKLTIGYGLNLDDAGISKDEARLLLQYRASAIRWNMVTTLPWTGKLDGPRQDALVNLAYNMGLSGLLGFHKMLAHAELGEWEAAADCLLDSKYAEQEGARANRLATQLRTGVRQ